MGTRIVYPRALVSLNQRRIAVSCQACLYGLRDILWIVDCVVGPARLRGTLIIAVGRIMRSLVDHNV